MFSLYRVIPESSQVRLPACSPGSDSPSASFPVPGSVALQAIGLPVLQLNSFVAYCAVLTRVSVAAARAIDAVRVLRPSNSPIYSRDREVQKFAIVSFGVIPLMSYWPGATRPSPISAGSDTCEPRRATAEDPLTILVFTASPMVARENMLTAGEGSR